MFTTISIALDHILNQTLIILPISRAKTPAARYTNHCTAPTVRKALHLLIRVQYLRSAKRGSRTRASIFADTSRNSFVSRPTLPKTQFTSAEAHGTFARRVDSAPIIDVSANASGSEQGQATGKRGKAPATNVTLRGDGADYAYPIGRSLVCAVARGLLNLVSLILDLGTVVCCRVWQAERVDHLLWASGVVISIELNAPGVQTHLAR